MRPTSTVLAVFSLGTMLATSVSGQSPASARAPVTVPKPVWTGISAKAQVEISTVSAAILRDSAQDAAKRDGFTPVLGWIPMMGTHWVNNPRMFNRGKTFKLTEPAQLMFSPVNGVERIVGAAYSYLTPVGDTARPASFDGNPSWHEHPDLAPAGMSLVMLHVWLVPSPDGPFAGHNPFLPYWAVNVTPPDADRMKDAANDIRVRKVALALSVVADTGGIFPLLHRRAAVRAVEAARGDTISSLLPELDAAARAKDWPRWDRLADRIVLQWEALRTMYLESTLVPENRARVQKFMDDMLMSPHNMAGHHH